MFCCSIIRGNGFDNDKELCTACKFLVHRKVIWYECFQIFNLRLPIRRNKLQYHFIIAEILLNQLFFILNHYDFNFCNAQWMLFCTFQHHTINEKCTSVSYRVYAVNEMYLKMKNYQKWHIFGWNEALALERTNRLQLFFLNTIDVMA